MPFTNSEESVTWSCSLEDVVDNMLEGMSLDGQVEDAEQQAICALVSARLRELANKIDAACAPSVLPAPAPP